MYLEEFVDSISKYEYFPYSHIMEIPESSFEYAKQLNHNHWNFVYKDTNAIALCCIIGDKIHILFPYRFFTSVNVPQSAIVEKGHVILMKSLVSIVEVVWPEEDNSIWFTNKQSRFGQLNIYYKESGDERLENLAQDDINLKPNNKKEKEMNYLETIESTVHSLGEIKSRELIRLILEDLANDDYEYINVEKSRSIEDKLKDLRDRYESKYQGPSMNLIPSDIKGACHSFCLALANKKFDKLRKGMDCGFRGIMLEMSAYWFSCLAVNKETLIVTSSWDNDVFDEQYKKIIDSYTKSHNKTVVIIEFGPTGFFKRYPY
jgi:hypothetical protein